MNKKTACKRLLDLLMTLLLLLLMPYQLWGNAAHEWLGCGMLLCFLLHQLLNLGWYRALGRGRWTPYRLVQTALNALLLLCMLALMGSGLLLSQTVFAFLPPRGGLALARVLHLLASYWGFLLMGLHLGLHWGMLWEQLRQQLPPLRRPGAARALRLAALAAAAYGAVVFFRDRIPTYLFLQTQFVFFDYSRAAPLVLADQLALLAAFLWLGHRAARLLLPHTARQG